MINLSKKTTLKIIGLILCIEAIFFIAPKFFSDFEPAAILVGLLGNLTNQERQLAGLPELKVNPILNEAAKLKADDMVNNSYFAHTSPKGITPWYWLDLVGYKYNYAGENLAVNFTNTEDVTAAWMNSPTHRANIVKSAYTEMGSAMATGTYKGKEAVFVVQVYGNPISLETQNIKISTSTKSEKTATAISGEILGTSTNNIATDTLVKISPINEQKLARPIIQVNNSTNQILVIILVVLILVVLLNMVIKFGGKYSSSITNIILIAIVIIIVWLVNIDLINKKLISSGIDYSKVQVNNISK